MSPALKDTPPGTSRHLQSRTTAITPVHREALATPSFKTILPKTSEMMPTTALAPSQKAPKTKLGPPEDANSPSSASHKARNNKGQAAEAKSEPSSQPHSGPNGQANPPSGNPQATGESDEANKVVFDEWMAKLYVQPGKAGHPGDVGTCCLAWWVPCALYGKTHWRLKQLADDKDPSDDSWKSKYGRNGPCWAFYALSIVYIPGES